MTGDHLVTQGVGKATGGEGSGHRMKNSRLPTVDVPATDSRCIGEAGWIVVWYCSRHERSMVLKVQHPVSFCVFSGVPHPNAVQAAMNPGPASQGMVGRRTAPCSRSLFDQASRRKGLAVGSQSPLVGGVKR